MDNAIYGLIYLQMFFMPLPSTFLIYSRDAVTSYLNTYTLIHVSYSGNPTYYVHPSLSQHSIIAYWFHIYLYLSTRTTRAFKYIGKQ